MFNCIESNEVLKLKFRKLHKKIVDGVNPVDVINFLFQEGVICAADTRALQRIRDDPHQQCIEMLALLHTSGNKQAFVQLYLAIKEEKSLEWLVEEIDKFTDQSLVDLIKQLYVSEPTGNTFFTRDSYAVTRNSYCRRRPSVTLWCCIEISERRR